MELFLVFAIALTQNPRSQLQRKTAPVKHILQKISQTQELKKKIYTPFSVNSYLDMIWSRESSLSTRHT